ncbi:MAG: sigma-70 family RNA polymerase sigma factor [Bacillota bacterium]|nr:sigma-70 family RNA polymerase sigma factor [Bacillota bacterium]
MEKLEERTLIAKTDIKVREQLIEDYCGFVLACARKRAGNYVDKSSDEYSVALIAFNEAIDKYDENKGNFEAFAAVVIKNRVTDYLRKENKRSVIPFSSLNQDDGEGSEKEFDLPDTRYSVSDAKIELESVKNELSNLGISFFDIADSSPKSDKTKRACYQAIKYILDHIEIKNMVLNNGRIPAASVSKGSKVKEKILERHRKYIVAGVIIISGGYNIISGYIKGGGSLESNGNGYKG